MAVTTPVIPPAAALQRAIAACAQQGWRLQSANANTASMVWDGGGTNHALHAVLSLVTCGAWLVVWLILVLADNSAPKHSMLVMVDEWGRVTYQQQNPQ
jgi:hypothetical protein